MQSFQLTLQIIGALIFVIALLHGALGHGAETLIGIPVPEMARTNPSQDSQNRFFVLAFALYGVVLWFAANDLQRYAELLNATMGVFFMAGLGRLISMARRGLPAAPVIALAVAEIVGPPILYLLGKGVGNAI